MIVRPTPAIDIHIQVEAGSDLLKILLLTGFQEDFRYRSVGQLRLAGGSVTWLIQNVGVRSGGHF